MGDEVIFSPTNILRPIMSSSDNLDMVLRSFIMNLRSPLTAKAYQLVIEEFFTFLQGEALHPHDLKRHHIIAYRVWLERKELASKTIQKKLAAISSLCRHLAEVGIIDKDITYGVSRPLTENKTETADLSDEEVRRVFAALSGAPKERLWKAVLAIGFFTGLRSSEIRSLRRKDLGEVKGVRIVRLKIKGGKTHEIPLHPFVCQTLDTYLEDKRGEVRPEAGDSSYLFQGRSQIKDIPISADALAYIFTASLCRAGIKQSPFRRYSPHSMRATFASHLLNKAEAKLEDVQAALGHANPSTTQKYNKRSKGHDKSPVWKIDY